VRTLSDSSEEAVLVIADRRGLSVAILIAASVLLAGSAVAGPKCGGTGGTRTQTFTCGAGELLDHVKVIAGQYANRIAFGCAKVGGGDGKSSGFLGGPDPRYNRDNRTGTATCQTGQFVWSLETQCGWYVDNVVEIRCGPISLLGGISQGMASQSINAGGSGGMPKSLQCPDKQAIYKVRVKSGDWIDSIEVFCRNP
jgi:hypothetical protein